MIVKLLTEYHLEFLSLKGGCRSSESTHVKMPNFWKSHAAAQLFLFLDQSFHFGDLKETLNQNIGNKYENLVVVTMATSDR